MRLKPPPTFPLLLPPQAQVRRVNDSSGAKTPEGRRLVEVALDIMTALRQCGK